MPHPDPRELANANIGSNVRPRSVNSRDLRGSRDLRASRNKGLSSEELRASQLPLLSIGATGDYIRVFPSVAEFKDIESSVTHVVTITVHNRSSHPRRIRFEAPKAKEFALHHIPQTAVAPGLEVSADLEFFSETAVDLSTEIFVLCETDRIRVPVRALLPRGELHFDGYCNFGAVPPNSQNIRYVDVVNRGSKAADFEVMYASEEPSFKVEPRMGRLGPEGSDDCFLRLKVMYAADEMGAQREIARVKVNGEVIGDTLDMSATVVRQQLVLAHPENEGELEMMQFGTLYAGEYRNQQLVVINDGSCECSYKVNIPRMDGIENDEVYWSIEPSTGTLQPFETRLVTVTYQPPRLPMIKGFKSNYDFKGAKEEHEVTASFVAMGMPEDVNATIKLQGRGVAPGVRVTPQILEFCETATNTNREQTVVLHNEHDELPVTFRVPKVPHFKCRTTNGKLLPHQSTEIVLSFAPNQMGLHSGVFRFELIGLSGQSVGEVEVLVKGNCHEEAKKIMKGGLTATEETFQPNFRFQAEEDLKLEASIERNKFVREKAWVKNPPDVNSDTIGYTFEAEKFERLHQNREKANQYLKRSHAKRNALHTFENSKNFALAKAEGMSGDPLEDPEYETPGLDMGMFGMPIAGMPPGAGLKAPTYNLPVANDPLWLKSNQDKDGTGTLIKPRTRIIDEDRIIQKKFKPAPTTGKEKKDCQSGLSHRSIMQISTYPSNLEFGNVCIQAPITKSFSVSNDTDQNILVRIDVEDNKALSQSKPESQVIPPGATAGFDVTLYLESTTVVDTKFAYVINDQHRFEVPVRAKAVPVMLTMSKSKLNFIFPPHHLGTTVSETFVLNNPGNNSAEFKVEQSANFSVLPNEGVVEPLSSEEITVTYRPGQSSLHEQTLQVDVVGGSVMTLECRGQVDQGRISMKTKAVDLGMLSAGAAMTKTFMLYSTGEASAVFNVDVEDLKLKCPGLSIVPERGMIPPGSSTQLTATMKWDRSMKLDTAGIINVRGGKTIKVAFKGEVVVPKVDLHCEEIDFGQCYLGATSTKHVMVENTSNVPVLMILDLRQNPEFTASVAESMVYEEEDEPDASAGENQAAVGAYTKFKLDAASKGQLTLNYSPATLGSHAFELPISINGVSTSLTRSMRRAIVAEAAKPRMLLSTPGVDFGEKIVVNEQMKGFTYHMDITLTNCDDSAFFMDARLKGPQADAGFFRMEAVSRELGNGKDVTLKIRFCPKHEQEYRCHLVICLDEVSVDPYFSLEVTGSGVFPSLGFDRREVIFPVAPLGIETSVTFYIINHGYDNLDVRHELPVESAQLPLSVSFPSGTMIGVIKTRLPVQVTFMSKKSMSFNASVDFLDSHGTKYSIQVIGSTDASYLSLFPFMSLQSEALHVATTRESKVPMVSQIADLGEPYIAEGGKVALNRLSSVSSVGTNVVGKAAPQSHAEFLAECSVLTQPNSVAVLLEWANLNILRTPITKFPHDIHEARGKQIIEVIEGSTNKQIPNQVKKLSGSIREDAQQMLNFYIEVCNFLKSFGALLNCARPEYMLPFNMFSKLFLDPKHGGDPKMIELQPFYEQHYNLVNSGTWLMVIYQVIHLFVMNRVTLKQVKALPGVESKYFQGLPVVGSNLYSTPELVLLAWMSYHHSLLVPTDKLHLANFDKDLHDCRVFGSIISSHVPSLKTHLSTLKKTSDPAEMLANAQVVADTIRGLGLEYCPSPEVLSSGSGRDLVLFCIYLYNTMPGFIPKATIEFEGRLNQPIEKYIELTNPSPKPLVYSIRIDGSKEFSCADSIRIGPKERLNFPITCLHKYRKPAQAQVFLIGERAFNGSAGSTLVFNLNSSVRTFNREQIVTSQTKLYEAISLEVPVKNHSQEHDTEIQVTIVELTDFTKNLADNKPKGRTRGAKPKKLNLGSAVTTSPLLPEKSFWVKKDLLKLKKGGSTTLAVNFLPLRLMGHSCLVFFSEDKFGEYCVELQVKVDLPATTETSKFTHQAKSVILKEINVSMRNSAIDKCRSQIMEMLGSAAGRDFFKSLGETARIDYKIDYASDCFNGPRELVLFNQSTSRVATPGQTKSFQNANKLPLELRPQGAGKYEGKLVLRSALDVRVMDLECTVTSLGTRAELTFECPARHIITQEIPILNYSDQAWQIIASLQGDYFTGMKEIQVPPMLDGQPGKTVFTLSFAPKWICKVQGELVLRNTTIGDSYQYQLTGVGEEPDAEDHFQFECRARWKKSMFINVRNILGDKPCRYKVESDLIGMSGADYVDVPSHGTADYELSIMMPRGGEFTGSVSFIHSSGEYIWYTIGVVAENPPAEKSIELRTKCRTAVAADITIVNPLNEDITFAVIIEGEGLLGAQSVTLRPQERTKYELIYSPLLEGEFVGGLTFVNDQMGEFWYSLTLVAEEADPEHQKEIVAELGKSNGIRIEIENPLGEEVEFEVHNSNPVNFYLDEGEDYIYLGPYQKSYLDLVYTPSTIRETEEATIMLDHPLAGKFVYFCSGRGERPSEMDLVRVSSHVGQSTSNMISFRNPLRRPITVKLSLEASKQEQQDAFVLLPGQANTLELPAFTGVDVPFLFNPNRMVEHSCNMVIQAVNEEVLKWTFPIIGTAEASASVYLGKFTCKARERVVQTFNLELTGTAKGAPGADGGKMELEVITPPEHREMMASALHLYVDDSVPKPPPGICRVRMSFEPLKAVRSKVQLRVTKENEGRWNFDMDLVVTQADVDDIISIEGALNKTSKVSFRMTNQFDSPAHFHAFFSLESPPEFTVSPTSGTLPAYGGEGIEFVVSFTPRSYGKIYVGKLIVETDEMQWTYEVHGEHPKYEAPQPKKMQTKVDTHIPREEDPDVYKSQLARHNYMKENAAAVRRPAGSASRRYANASRDSSRTDY